MIFLIAAMDNPFRGDLSIGSDGFQTVYATTIKPNDAVNRSMEILINETDKLGAPRLEGKDFVAGKEKSRSCILARPR